MMLPPPPAGQPRPLETILYGGLVVAVLDILNATSFWALYKGVSVTRVLQGVAAGVLGRSAAMAGGLPTACLGAVLHVFIAFSVAAVFYVGCRMWPALLRRPVWVGLLYGLLVFAVMNDVVIPLSRIGVGPPPPGLWLRDEIIGHALTVGLPVALIARWSADRRRGSA